MNQETRCPTCHGTEKQLLQIEYVDYCPNMWHSTPQQPAPEPAHEFVITDGRHEIVTLLDDADAAPEQPMSAEQYFIVNRLQGTKPIIWHPNWKATVEFAEDYAAYRLEKFMKTR